MRGRRPAALAGTAIALAALLAPIGSSAVAEPQAEKAGEEIVRYLTKGKLKAAKKITYRFVCGVTCNVKVDATVVLPGPNFRPPPVSGTNFAPGVALEDKLKPNGPLLKAIKRNKRKAKLRTKITATDVATGQVDVDKRTYRFK